MRSRWRGVSANPAVIEAVKYGILVAWAFAESVLDVRTLLSGGKITMIKSDADWTSNVHKIPELLSAGLWRKIVRRDWIMDNMLPFCFLFHKGNTLAMRTMDVEEAYVQTQEGYENFQMTTFCVKLSLLPPMNSNRYFLALYPSLKISQMDSGFKIIPDIVIFMGRRGCKDVFWTVETNNYPQISTFSEAGMYS